MRLPFDHYAYLTSIDTDVLLNIRPNLTQIPSDGHCGAFGTPRKHDIHTGIDFYVDEGTPVYAMQEGTVVAVMPFTGVDANCPWWLDTQAVAVEDADGVWLYGEIAAEVVVGDVLIEGSRVGEVRRVLRHDKGRPMSMLHMERYVHGTREFAPLWELDKPQPASLIDPTEIFIALDNFDEWAKLENSKSNLL